MSVRRHLWSASLALAVTALLTSCASTGAPLPPSLELPKPPSDLRGARKGDKVTLVWTRPTETTDHQTVRHLGSSRICRSKEPALIRCGMPVAEVPPFKPAAASAEKKSTPADRLKQVGMGARATALQLAGFFPIDQDPVGFDMAVAPALPVPGQSMVPLARRERLVRPQQADDRLELLHRLAPLLQAFHVPVELRRRAQRQGRRWFGGVGLGPKLRLGQARSPAF